jgi:hypothetical protein
MRTLIDKWHFPNPMQEKIRLKIPFGEKKYAFSSLYVHIIVYFYSYVAIFDGERGLLEHY